MLLKIYISLFLVLLVPSVFAEGAGTPNWSDLFFKSANFILLLVILHILASKPAKKMLRGILNKNADEFELSPANLEKAKKEYEALQTKIKDLDNDLVEMRKHSLEIVEEEKIKIIQDAQNFAEKMVEQTDAKIKQKFIKAEQEIKSFMIEQSISIASRESNLQKIDQKTLLNQFSTQIEEANQ